MKWIICLIYCYVCKKYCQKVECIHCLKIDVINICTLKIRYILNIDIYIVSFSDIHFEAKKFDLNQKYTYKVNKSKFFILSLSKNMEPKCYSTIIGLVSWEILLFQTTTRTSRIEEVICR